MNIMNIGLRFRELRYMRRLCQEEVGAKIGQPRQAVTRFEMPGNDPTMSTLISMLSTINVPLAEFFEGKIPPKYPKTEHQELHEKLQSILDVNADFEKGINYEH